ncbi:antirestriction protein [Escherichia coli]|uniref:antirestriction protein n=1 Tax=Escherichia coli TaxID=562 RepID=UPI00201CD5D6|nr:antirestriction protein [Escherichia coli]
MKTLSQNTTSSACAPETGLQQLVATIVPDEQRISFWPQHFGLIPQWVTLEPRVFGWMDRLCENYCGGIWNLYTLNNGGAFMAPVKRRTKSAKAFQIKYENSNFRASIETVVLCMSVSFTFICLKNIHIISDIKIFS